MASGPLISLKLPRSRRIKSGRDFVRIKVKGARVPSGCLIANWTDSTPGAPSRLGVITGRKVGKSVERSRARRLLREAFRHCQADLIRPVDLVLVARPSIEGKGLDDVCRDLLNALRRGGILPKAK